jgi:hypothetical protein
MGCLQQARDGVMMDNEQSDLGENRSGANGGRVSVRVAVSRVRAASRGVAFGAPAIMLGLIVLAVLGKLEFSPTGFSNRVVDYSLAALVIPVAGLAIYAGLTSARYFLLSFWPGPLGMVFDERSLRLSLGPFGCRDYDVQHLDIQYPFEQPGDLAGDSFEAFLPVEEQMATLVPRISHRGEPEAIDRRVLRFAAYSEEELAGMVRDVVSQWRASQASDHQASL